MTTLRMQAYVIIGQRTNGELCWTRLETLASTVSLYGQETVQMAHEKFRHDYPDAVIVKATHKDGSGGAGWSKPYDLEIGP